MSDTTAAELDAVLGAAAIAFRAARTTSETERARWLRAVADRLDAGRDDLVIAADAETGLGVGRLEGEVGRTTGQLRLFADVIEEGAHLEVVIDHGDASATPPRPDLRRMLVPLGPVAVYAASNFPFAFSVAGGDTASALAVGCAVVVKAHPGHPETSRLTARLVTEALSGAGAPPGLFALVEGYDAGVALVEHRLVAAAAFTGSLQGGRALFDRAAARPDPIPFYGELGSLNPVVVTAGADAERGAELAAGLAGSFQLGAGQFCTKPGLVLVPIGSELERALPRHVGAAPHRLLHDGIESGFRAGASRLGEVAEVVARAHDDGDVPGAVAYAVDVAAFADPRTAEVLTSEVFGPTTLLVRYSGDAELAQVLRTVEGSLTATVHAADGEPLDELVALLAERAGRVLFGGWPTGVAVTWSQHHGGPWPATTSVHTSVGATAVRRFQRPLVLQDAPAALLPPALQDDNPLGIPRRVDGRCLTAS